jgi:hypothetical protein
LKGIVFTEFLEMVENTVSEEVADRLLDECELESGGVYTSLGTYDHREMLTLVTHLSEISGTPVPDLVKVFGEYLLGRFVVQYPGFFQESHDSFDLLSKIENHIHVEVKKLYPQAELPTFDCQSEGSTMILTYTSKRPFADLADGLIRGCCAHYGEAMQIDREDLPGVPGTGARFTLTKS